MKFKVWCILAAVAAFSTAFAEIAVKNGEKVGFLGDSITSLGGRNQAGYVNLVISGLKVNGINIKAVKAGIGGYKSNQMLKFLPRGVLRHKPNMMLLSCGVNDVWHGKRGIALDAYKKNITEIVDKAQAAKVRVAIMTATMIGENTNSNYNKKLALYNEFLRQLAKEKNCLLIDTNAAMLQELARLKQAYPNVKSVFLTTDGVHMNPAGDVLMAETILKAFGLNDEQLAKAKADWQEKGNNFAKIQIKVKHMPKIYAIANAEKTTIFAAISKTLDKALSE